MTVDTHEDDALTRRLRALVVTGPEPERVTQRVLAEIASTPAPTGSRLKFAVLTLAMVGALLVATSYYVPVLGIALAEAPVVRSPLALLGLSRLTDRTSRLESSSTSSGVTLDLRGGHTDAAATILVLEHQPAGKLDLERTTLRDQFGRTYAVRGVATDFERGESVMLFEPLSGPAATVGARLNLVITAIEVGSNPVQLTYREGRWILGGVLAAGGARDLDRPAPVTIDGVRFEFVSVRDFASGLEVTMHVTGIDPKALNERLPDGGKGRPRVQLRLNDGSGAGLDPWLVQTHSLNGEAEVRAFWASSHAGTVLLTIELADRGALQVPIVRP
jgi:hypothetical protein